MVKKFTRYHAIDALVIHTLDHSQTHVERFVLAFCELF